MLNKEVHWHDVLSVHQWPGFSSRSRHTKDSKMVLDISWLNNQNYKVPIKDKWSNPGQVVVTFVTPRCWGFLKGSFRVTVDYGGPNIYKVKLATFVEGEPKDPFSIATKPRCRGGATQFPGLLHFTLDPYVNKPMARYIDIYTYI